MASGSWLWAATWLSVIWANVRYNYYYGTYDIEIGIHDHIDENIFWGSQFKYFLNLT